MEKNRCPKCFEPLLFCKDTKLSSITIINSVKKPKSKEKIVYLKKKNKKKLKTLDNF